MSLHCKNWSQSSTVVHPRFLICFFFFSRSGPRRIIDSVIKRNKIFKIDGIQCQNLIVSMSRLQLSMHKRSSCTGWISPRHSSFYCLSIHDRTKIYYILSSHIDSKQAVLFRFSILHRFLCSVFFSLSLDWLLWNFDFVSILPILLWGFFLLAFPYIQWEKGNNIAGKRIISL